VQAPVRERETERERLPFRFPANGTPAQPPVQVASFVTLREDTGQLVGRRHIWRREIHRRRWGCHAVRPP